jgi:hypothetical protein
MAAIGASAEAPCEAFHKAPTREQSASDAGVTEQTILRQRGAALT